MCDFEVCNADGVLLHVHSRDQAIAQLSAAGSNAAAADPKLLTPASCHEQLVCKHCAGRNIVAFDRAGLRERHKPNMLRLTIQKMPGDMYLRHRRCVDADLVQVRSL